MDFGALPPEVNSGRMYMGAGAGSMLAASAAWESLAGELQSAAAGYQSAITTLTEEWLGPTSMSMAAAVTPYVSWMRVTAEQCELSANQATAAAAAYEAAHAMTVPPPLIAANRARLMALIATNFLGQNTPAIMATEAEYSEMWAQDATAMYSYAASSAAASSFKTFAPPPQTTNPGGVASRAGAVARMAGVQAGGHVRAASAQVMSSVPRALHTLSTPGSASGLSGMAMGSGASAASAATSPASALGSLGGAPGKAAAGAVKGAASGGSAPSGLNGLASFMESPTGVVLGTGSGVAGDVGGTISDVGGVGMDLFGLGLDFSGAQSVADGAGGALGGVGLIGDVGGGESLASLANAAQTSASVGHAVSLGTLSVPPGWANAVSSVTPLPALDANVMPGGWGAAPAGGPSLTGTKMPLGGMVGRESDGAVQRIGFRTSMIPRSPVAG
ncbi:MAG: PPE family protein [Mycobacterium sp.]|nr:PPE family protein [Mycobacterium sp.]